MLDVYVQVMVLGFLFLDQLLSQQEAFHWEPLLVCSSILILIRLISCSTFFFLFRCFINVFLFKLLSAIADSNTYLVHNVSTCYL
jgi:hypothetical protein